MTVNELNRYKRAWTNHIKELTHLALAANISFDRWTKTRDELKNWLDDAVQNIIKKELDNE